MEKRTFMRNGYKVTIEYPTDTRIYRIKSVEINDERRTEHYVFSEAPVEVLREVYASLKNIDSCRVSKDLYLLTFYDGVGYHRLFNDTHNEAKSRNKLSVKWAKQYFMAFSAILKAGIEIEG